MEASDFLPVSAEEMHARGWWWYDALVVGGDAYIDHPSFGTAVISRVLEAAGYRVAVLPQPDWHSADAFRAMGRFMPTGLPSRPTSTVELLSRKRISSK